MNNDKTLPEFQLTKVHVTLVRATCWRWQNAESGSPCVDPKAPYGNSTPAQIAAGIRKLLGVPAEACPHCEGEINSDLSDENALVLHRQTLHALRVIMSSGSFEPGLYRNTAEKYARPVYERVSD